MAILLISSLGMPTTSHAWFFFFPGSLIQRALEKDPDKIEVSYKDRLAGKCGGFHLNLAVNREKSDEEKTFHSAMADKAIEAAEDKIKTKELAEAYSVKWGRAASVDINTNRAYGSDLVSGCRSVGVPRSVAEQRENQRQEEAKRQEEIKRQEEAKLQQEVQRQLEIRQQEEAKRQEEVRLQAEAEAKVKAEAEAAAAAEKSRLAAIEAAKTPPKSLEEQLKELKQLYGKGLITKDVYNQRQKELLTRN